MILILYYFFENNFGGNKIHLNNLFVNLPNKLKYGIKNL